LSQGWISKASRLVMTSRSSKMKRQSSGWKRSGWAYTSKGVKGNDTGLQQAPQPLQLAGTGPEPLYRDFSGHHLTCSVYRRVPQLFLPASHT
jgi:hypothetical protein